MDSKTIRQKFLDFFKTKMHAEIKPARLVLDNDPTTLFTSSGMQPLIPYLMGEMHPLGIRLVNSQPCFRSEDIMEVGDNRHITFFEMLGNWSLGDYFKKEEIEWLFKFLTKELALPLDKLHVTCFEGNDVIPKDEQSAQIWKSLGISEDRIHLYGIEKNWWSRSGKPDNMPIGEIGGPDTEVFFDFGEHLHDLKFGEKCHPNCDCGRFLEICNGVFIEYKKVGDNEFDRLSQQNVDFGGGLERLTAATNDNHDIFYIDLYKDVISVITEKTGQQFEGENRPPMRIIADHMRAATFLILDGVVPSNKLHGYVLRRLLRRSAVKMKQLRGEILVDSLASMIEIIMDNYDGLFGVNKNDFKNISAIVSEELTRFQKTLDKGLKEVEKIDFIDGKKTFDLYQTFGFPYEVTEELFKQKGQHIDHAQFEEEFKKHQELSRAGSVGKFAGGLAGHSEIEIKYHTATHLLHQALRDVLGPQVFQQGSNITPERLRFDFSFDRKLTDKEIKKVEDLVNKKIKQDLKVDRKFMSVDEAKKLNAIGLFNEKYKNLQSSSGKLYDSDSRTLPFSDEKGGKQVSIYMIGPNYVYDPQAKDQRERGGYYSAEFCGGPHVEHTGVIGRIEITKEEAISAGVRRLRVELTSDS